MEDEKPIPSSSASGHERDRTSFSKDEEDGPPRRSSGNGIEDDFEVGWDGEKDTENPKNISTLRKWIISLTLVTTSFCITCNSTIYTFTYDQLKREFGTPREVATLGLTLFVLGLATGPMFLAPMSEFYGRRIVYLCSTIGIFIFIIPCAVAQNIETIIVTRFFDGVAASAFLSVAGGTIGDMFDKKDLSLPMMVYSGSPFLGPAGGPIIGGFINQYIDWRWTFWLLLIWTGVMFVLIFLVVPETYAPVLLRRKAQKLRRETGNTSLYAPIEQMSRSLTKTLYLSCTRPFQMLLLEPMVLNLCLLTAMLLGILYLFFGAFIVIFQENYGFTLSQVGLSFLGLFVGMIFGILSDLYFSRNYTRLVRNREKETGEVGVSEPEYRLPPTIFGAQMVWIGMFLFAWTTYPFIHWAVPIALSGLVGLGIVTSFGGIQTFLVESYPLYAASALACSAILRGLFASVFPLFGVYMYENLGFQWASTLLAFLLLVLAPFPYIFFIYGKKIRAKSKFATSGN